MFQTRLDKIEEIMNYPERDFDDISELSSIRFRQSIDTGRLMIEAAAQEEEYSRLRGRQYKKYKSSKRKDGKFYSDDQANRLSVLDAEEAHGKYRTLKAEARADMDALKSLEQYIIVQQGKLKNEKDASGYDIQEEAQKGISGNRYYSEEE